MLKHAVYLWNSLYDKLFYKFVVDTEAIAYLHFELHAAQVALEAKSTSSPH